MAIRSPWVLPALALILAAVLGIVVFGGATLGGTQQPPQQAAPNTLEVPRDYSTVQAAINAAHPGETIIVAPGTYHENILLDKPLILVAEFFDPTNPTNNNTILDGGTDGEATIFIPHGVSPGPAIRGFVIRNSKDGIEAQSQLIIEDNYFYSSEIAVEYLTEGGGLNRNNLYFNSANDAIHVDDMSIPLLVQNNRILYAGDDAIEIDLPGTSAVGRGINVDIWDNLLIGSSQDGLKFVDYATNPRDIYRKISIAGNLIAGNRRAGIGFVGSGNTTEDYSGVQAAEAVRVYNNTFYGNDYGISGGGNAVLFNNIIANSTSLGAWRVQSPPGGDSVVAYTLFFNNHVDMDQTLVGPGDILGQDPLFLGAPGPGPDGTWGTVDDDYSGLLLRPESPAVDKGVTQYRTASGEAVPPMPLTGYVGAAPDLGWKELGSAFFSTPAPATAAPPPAATIAPAQATRTASVTPAAASTGKPVITQTPAAPASTGAPTGTPSPTDTMTSTPAAGTPLLIVQGITPASVRANSTVTLVIQGTGFENGAGVEFEGMNAVPPQVTGVQVVDTTTMNASIVAPGDVNAAEQWNVRVTNPDGTTALLLGAFTITP